jgi:transposase InsO family protein
LTYELIQQMESAFQVVALCEALGVSRAAYYRYLSGQTYQPSERKQKQIKSLEDAFWDHKRRYGSRRLVVELEELNEPIGRHRVGSLMRQQGLKAIQPSSFVPRTTDSRHGKRVCDNLLLTQPLPLTPDRVWVGDITYLPLVNNKWAYLATWMDLYSRMMVGWQLDDNMEEDLIISALHKGLSWRKPAPGLIVHSDRGG